jgi:hypothetical protein
MVGIEDEIARQDQEAHQRELAQKSAQQAERDATKSRYSEFVQLMRKYSIEPVHYYRVTDKKEGSWKIRYVQEFEYAGDCWIPSLPDSSWSGAITSEGEVITLNDQVIYWWSPHGKRVVRFDERARQILGPDPRANGINALPVRGSPSQEGAHRFSWSDAELAEAFRRLRTGA